MDCFRFQEYIARFLQCFLFSLPHQEKPAFPPPHKSVIPIVREHIPTVTEQHKSWLQEMAQQKEVPHL